MERELPCYQISIDPSLSEDGNPLKVDMIAYTANPAIITKGFAFDEQAVKKFRFEDEKKLRLFAPILIPDLKIYRKDNELGEYNVKFSAEVIEQLMTQFMIDKPAQQFNLDHKSQLNPKSDIIEIWKVRNSKTDYSFTEFGIEVPEGSYVCISQFHDAEYFQKEIIEKGRTGLSIEGILGLALNTIIKQNQMEKNQTEVSIPVKQKFEKAALEDGTNIFIDKKEVGGGVFIIDDNGDKEPIFDGEHVVKGYGVIATVGGKITEMKPDAPVEAEKKEDKKDEAPADEKVDEKLADEPAAPAAPAIDEAAILAVVQPKLDEIISAIAELKTEIESAKTEDVEMSKVKESKMNGIDSLASFFKMSQQS